MRHRADASASFGRGHYVALAGEFFVLGELALRGLDGTLTLGHTKEIDVLVLNRRTGRTFKVEVKTTSSGPRRSAVFGGCYAWFMDERHGHLSDDSLVYCFTVIRPDERRFFLVPSDDVARYIRWEFERFMSHVRKRSRGTSSMRTFRLPATADGCPMPDPWRDGRWRTWMAADAWTIFETG